MSSPMFSRGHYCRLAALLECGMSELDESGREYVADRLAELFQSDNWRVPAEPLLQGGQRGRSLGSVVMDADFAIRDHGSIVLLEPLSAEAEAWVEEYVNYEQVWGDAIVCEPRYISPIIEAMEAEGLVRQERR